MVLTCIVFVSPQGASGCCSSAWSAHLGAPRPRMDPKIQALCWSRRSAETRVRHRSSRCRSTSGSGHHRSLSVIGSSSVSRSPTTTCATTTRRSLVRRSTRGFCRSMHAGTTFESLQKVSSTSTFLRVRGNRGWGTPETKSWSGSILTVSFHPARLTQRARRRNTSSSGTRHLDPAATRESRTGTSGPRTMHTGPSSRSTAAHLRRPLAGLILVPTRRSSGFPTREQSARSYGIGCGTRSC